jgi:integrase
MRERQPGVWELRVFAGHDGTRKVWKSRTFRGGEQAAREALATFESEVASMDLTTPDHFTVAQLVDRYIDSRIDEWSPSTTRDARHLAKNHLSRLGDIDARRLRPVQVDDFLRALRDHPATARNARSLLRAAYEDAIRLELVDRNPARLARVPAQPKRTKTTPTLDRVAQAIKIATSDGDHGMAVLIRVAAMTGARRGELLALRWNDMDLEQATVAVTRAVVTDGHELTIKSTKTGRPKRVAIDPATVAALNEWQARCRRNGLQVGHPLDGSSFVWSQNFEGSVPWWPDTVSKRWRRIADRAGLEHVRFHDLRHAMVSALIGAGYDPRTVADRAGHSSPAVTLGMYADSQPARDRDAATYLAGVMDGHEGAAQTERP